MLVTSLSCCSNTPKKSKARNKTITNINAQNQMKKNLKHSLLLAAITLAFGCGSSTQTIDSDRVVVVPEPLKMDLTGECIEVTSFYCDRADTALLGSVDYMNEFMKMPLDGMGVAVKVGFDSTLKEEAYKIVSSVDGGVTVLGGGLSGAQYGMVTVAQLSGKGHCIPTGTIYDEPRFAWRGFMLDVSRHFQPKERIFEILDLMLYHKLNKFHLHLTDGIGWRIEIDAYPELTGRGAWRTILREDAPWVGMRLSEEGADNTYGGYFTKDDIREIVAYASARGIEVIPEIEMPGHSEAATQCYPEYSCVNARPGSGVYCASSEETYEFLFTILSEVSELFPSQYMHIGGDEVGKGQWAACPHCQALKAAKGLKDEHELQSYFVSRINEHVISLGKKLVGWDEITEGGLTESATVMSWTGYQNGIKAAEHGNYVVMCPLDYVYFDHYQGYNNFEPQAWGGLNDLKRVYDFSVIPDELDAQYHQYIMGGQANLWTENISTWEHLMYMTLPRLSALSETLWSSPERKDWDRFARKAVVMMDRYEDHGYNYSESAFTPRVGETTLCEDGSLRVTLSTELPSIIRYTTDGEEPTATSAAYDNEILVSSLTTIKALAFDESGRQRGYMLTLCDLDNLATGKKVSYQTPFNRQYNGGGESALVDGRYAVKRGDDKTWQGFERDDAIFTVDLAQEEQVSEVAINFFQHIGSTSVMLPLTVEVLTSVDGKEFTSQKKVELAQSEKFDAFVENVALTFDKTSARYVQIKAENRGRLPRNIHHPRGGENGWVFMDEVTIK